MAEMNLEVYTDLGAIPGEIDFNFDRLRDQIGEKMEEYKQMVYTSTADAREDRAKLNKLRTQIEERRKEIKAACLAPYNGFAEKATMLVDMISEPIKAIDDQIASIKAQKDDAKKEAIQGLFSEIFGGLTELVRLEQIWNPKWLNVSYTDHKIQEELEAIEADITACLASIDDMENSRVIRKEYLSSLDINRAIQAGKKFAADLKAQQEAEFERKKAAAAELERKRAAAAEIKQGAATEKKYRLRFEAHLTIQQAKDLSSWLKSNGIDYARI